MIGYLESDLDFFVIISICLGLKVILILYYIVFGIKFIYLLKNFEYMVYSILLKLSEIYVISGDE